MNEGCRTMRYLIPHIFVVVIALTACNTSKKMEAYIQHLYQGRVEQDTTWSAIRCMCDIPETFSSAARVKTKKFYESESVPTYTFEINPRVPFEIFSKQCFVSAEATGLMRKLGKKWVEIHLLSAPAPFKYAGNIYPIFTKLKFTYTLYDGTAAVKKGEIVLDDNNDAVGNPYANWKQLTKAYLYRYECRLKALIHESVLRMKSELQEVAQ